MSVTANETGSSGPPEGIIPPELTLMQTDAPQGAFFYAEVYTVTNADTLKHLGWQADPAEIVHGVLVHVGLLDSVERITWYRELLPTLENGIEELAERNSQDSESLSDAEFLEFKAREGEIEIVKERLQKYKDTDLKIKVAAEYYRQEAWRDLDNLSHVYDVTEEFQHTTLLATIKQLKELLPRPRPDGRSNEQARLLQQNALDAERIARVLIADEIGKLK